MAVRSTDLFGLLARVGNSIADGEYYLPDIVMLAAADGRRSAVVETGADEAAGVNRRSEIALVVAAWERSSPQAAQTGGIKMIQHGKGWIADLRCAGRVVVGETQGSVEARRNGR